MNYDLIVTLEQAEKFHVLKTLRANGYNRTKTADILKIGIRTLQRKLKVWGLERVGLKNEKIKEKEESA